MDELFAWIESFTNLERSGAVFSARAYQLERMRLLARRLGDPQDAFRCLHVAGSKGKGSTAALLAWSLQVAVLGDLYTPTTRRRGGRSWPGPWPGWPPTKASPPTSWP